MKTVQTKLAPAVAFILSFLACSVLADADSVKKEFQRKFPDVAAERVTKTSYNDLYEIFTGGEILYTDEKVNFIFEGHIVDTLTRTSVTDARLQKLNVVKFDELPFEHAIKLVRGDGSRRLAVFEDPNCGYCKKFEQDLNAIDNITAYIYAYPILAADSMTKSKAIWCSKDRLKAWQDMMLRQTAPTAETTCENPIEQIVALGRKLRISGTPLTIFEDGERLSGALPRERIEAKIQAASVAKATGKAAGK